ncbi:RHS repeat-associated core domain-containing protein [Paraburkholderia agricolaris]|uniref:RHS repeat-associated core domain-containing protein n=1 Tax=Paraburkholderia agricolaris TaxID=2152888 RepID=A0ABW9A371_9BURK
MVKRDPVSGKVADVQEFPNLPGHQTQQYGYAQDSRDLTRVVLNDATVDYMRDAEHRITQAQYTLNDEAPKTFTFAYDALGRRSKATLGNGIAIAYTWDAAGQLTGITYGRSDGTTIGTLTYTYDAAGRRTGMGGSLAKTTLPQPVADAQYNGANQLTRWAGKTFTYDANGSLTGDGVNRYGWGVTGEFSQIDSADGSSIQYQYDVLGRRKRTIANGSRTTDYLNVGDDLALANTDNDWSHRLQQFPLFIGGAPDELLMRRNGDDPATDRYVLRDANNNVIALTDAGQNIVTQYRYEPYGQTTLTGATDANPQQYTGRENDGTGLYYYRNRYYSPATGRFISEDPIGWASGQTNAYAYVGGNPVQSRDRFGLAKVMPGGLIDDGASCKPQISPLNIDDHPQLKKPATHPFHRGLKLADHFIAGNSTSR